MGENMENEKKFTKAGLLPTIALTGAAILAAPAVNVEIDGVDGERTEIGSVAYAGVGVGGGKSGGGVGVGGGRGGKSGSVGHGGGGHRAAGVCDYREVGVGTYADVSVKGLEKTNPVYLTKLKQDNLWQTSYNQHDLDANVTGKILVVYNDNTCDFETLTRFNKRIMEKIEKNLVQPVVKAKDAPQEIVYNITVQAPAEIPAVKEVKKEVVVKDSVRNYTLPNAKPNIKKEDPTKTVGKKEVYTGGFSTDAETIARAGKVGKDGGRPDPDEIKLTGQNGEELCLTRKGFIDQYGDALYTLLILGGIVIIGGIAYKLRKQDDKEKDAIDQIYGEPTSTRDARRIVKKQVRQEVKKGALQSPANFVAQDGSQINNLDVNERNFW